MGRLRIKRKASRYGFYTDCLNCGEPEIKAIARQFTDGTIDVEMECPWCGSLSGAGNLTPEEFKEMFFKTVVH